MWQGDAPNLCGKVMINLRGVIEKMVGTFGGDEVGWTETGIR